MQHDLRKHHGGEWEVTAGGSALQGENGLEAAIRELKEETGLNADKLHELYMTVIIPFTLYIYVCLISTKTRLFCRRVKQ